MAAERPDKEKKKRRGDDAGVSKSAKKDKKDRKAKKEKLAAVLDGELQRNAEIQPPTSAALSDDEAAGGAALAVAELPLARTVVPFAVPVADEKGMKKIYKSIRKAAKQGTLKRGVKEVVKTLRKSPPATPGNTAFPGVVVIAGDISPADVISHLPVLCEDHNVPFIFVTSRAELGAAAKTKRPTSVVMVLARSDSKKKQQAKDLGKGKEGEDAGDDKESFADIYAALVKYAQREYTKQAFWAKGEL